MTDKASVTAIFGDDEIPADEVLEKQKGQLAEVLLLGVDHEGDLVIACNHDDGAQWLKLAQMFSHLYLDGRLDGLE